MIVTNYRLYFQLLTTFHQKFPPETRQSSEAQTEGEKFAAIILPTLPRQKFLQKVKSYERKAS